MVLSIWSGLEIIMKSTENCLNNKLSKHVMLQLLTLIVLTRELIQEGLMSFFVEVDIENGEIVAKVSGVD